MSQQDALPISFDAALSRIAEAMRNEPISFVATPCTPWHCLGMDAFIARRRARGDDRPGFVLLIPHPKDGLVISRDTFDFLANDNRTTILSIDSLIPNAMFRSLMVILAVLWHALWFALFSRTTAPTPLEEAPAEAPVLLGVRTPDLFTLMNLRRFLGTAANAFHVVSVDEGLGTYRSHEFLVATTRRDRSHPGRSVLATEIDVFLRHSYWRLQRLLCGRIPRSEFFLYSKTLPEGELEINPDIATAYQSVINLRVQSTGVQRSSTERTTALLVSQDWSANGSYPEEAEADFLPRVVAAFNVLGFAVIVKPHPRERPQRYDNLVASGQCTLADHAQCVEHLFATLSTNDIVVGDSSSSLASAVSLFDRSAYSFGTFLSQRYPALPYHVTAQEDFRQLTGRFVLPIETIVGFSDAFEQSDPRDE